jgi:hypothetical protein
LCALRSTSRSTASWSSTGSCSDSVRSKAIAQPPFSLLFWNFLVAGIEGRQKQLEVLALADVESTIFSILCQTLVAAVDTNACEVLDEGVGAFEEGKSASSVRAMSVLVLGVNISLCSPCMIMGKQKRDPRQKAAVLGAVEGYVRRGDLTLTEREPKRADVQWLVAEIHEVSEQMRETMVDEVGGRGEFDSMTGVQRNNETSLPSDPRRCDWRLADSCMGAEESSDIEATECGT